MTIYTSILDSRYVFTDIDFGQAQQIVRENPGAFLLRITQEQETLQLAVHSADLGRVAVYDILANPTTDNPVLIKSKSQAFTSVDMLVKSILAMNLDDCLYPLFNTEYKYVDQAFKKLKTVAFNHNQLNDLRKKQITAKDFNESNIYSLSIGDEDVDILLKPLLEALPNNYKMQHLDIGGIKFTSKTIKMLNGTPIENLFNNHLRSISLTACEFEDDLFMLFVREIANNKHIKKLTLRDVSPLQFAWLLTNISGSSLTELNITVDSINPINIANIKKFLQANLALESIGLNCQGWKAVMPAMEEFFTAEQGKSLAHSRLREFHFYHEEFIQHSFLSASRPPINKVPSLTKLCGAFFRNEENRKKIQSNNNSNVDIESRLDAIDKKIRAAVPNELYDEEIRPITFGISWAD